MKKIIFAGFILILLLAACGKSSETDNSTGSSNETEEKPKITIGSKNFTEALILGEIYSLALENEGYEVERKLNLGGTLVAHTALINGEIDMYPEYTGTGLLSILKEEPKSDAQEVYDIVSEAYKFDFDLVWLEPTDANNSQALVTTKKISDEYGFTKLSELSEIAPELRLASVPEFSEREDGLKGLQEFYGGFQFESDELFDFGVKYRVILDGEADVTVGFTTDGDLVSDDLVLLEDDKGFWPPYYVAPVMRQEILDQSPEAADVLNEISALLDSEKVQKLNAEVDIEKREYEEVAKEFLVQEGILSEG